MQISICIPIDKYNESKQSFDNGDPVISDEQQHVSLTYDLKYVVDNISIFDKDYVKICMLRYGLKWNACKYNAIPGSGLYVAEDVAKRIVKYFTPESTSFFFHKLIFDDGINGFLLECMTYIDVWFTAVDLCVSLSHWTPYYIMSKIINTNQDSLFEQYLYIVNHIKLDYSIPHIEQTQRYHYTLTQFVRDCVFHDNYKILKHHLTNIDTINSGHIILFNTERSIIGAITKERFVYAELLMDFCSKYKDKIKFHNELVRFYTLSLNSLVYLHSVIDRFELDPETIENLLYTSIELNNIVQFTYLSTVYPLIATQLEDMDQLEPLFMEVMTELITVNNELMTLL